MIEEDIAAHKWRGQHKGVAWEVSHHAMGHELINHGHGVWTAYFYIDSRVHKQTLERLEESMKNNDRETGMGHPIELDDLGWNHGVTFFEYLINPLRECKHMKIGHDYNHLWDVENDKYKSYNFEKISSDIKVIVDRFVGEVVSKDDLNNMPQSAML